MTIRNQKNEIFQIHNVSHFEVGFAADTMDLIDTTLEGRHEMMRKRHAFLCALAEPYGSPDEFAGDKDEWLAVSGIELTRNEEYIPILI